MDNFDYKKYLKQNKLLTESFQAGDMWSKNFDYEGMLKSALQVSVDDGVEYLESLYSSFEDVNYHSGNEWLGKAIDALKEGDIERAEAGLEMFKRMVGETLGGLNESYDDYEEPEIYDFEIESEDGETTLYFYKEGGRWYEGQVDGEAPYGWGGKKYMSYLTPQEILNYVRGDYPEKDWRLSSNLFEAEEKSDDSKVEKVVDELDDEMKDIIKGLEKELTKAAKDKKNLDEQAINEGFTWLTAAGIAVALPAIMGLIARIGKAAGKFIKGIVGEKPTDEEMEKTWFGQLGDIAEKLHHLYLVPIEKVVGKFVKDEEKKKKIANVIFHVIVAAFLIASGVGTVKAIKAKEISLSTLEGAMTAIKSGEIWSFIADSAELGDAAAGA